MTLEDRKRFDPVDVWKDLYDIAERHWNEMFQIWANNTEAVKFTNIGLERQAKILEVLRPLQERWLHELNLPSRQDLANISSMNIQVEEKVDALEEQLWEVSNSLGDVKKELENVVSLAKDVVQVSKLLKQEVLKTKKQLSEVQSTNQEVLELKAELAQLKAVIEEISEQKTEVIDPRQLVTNT